MTDAYQNRIAVTVPRLRYGAIGLVPSNDCGWISLPARTTLTAEGRGFLAPIDTQPGNTFDMM